MELNTIWEQRIKDKNADFVYFVDISMFPAESRGEYSCAVLFGKSLSKEYIKALKLGEKPKTKEVFNTEHKMDALAVKIAEELKAEGYKSIGKLKVGILPHKSVALRAGLGFIGKNNLLITAEYGCAVMLGKVLTTAPFVTRSAKVQEPQCKNCNACVEVCPTQALLNKTWTVTTTREEILVRKLCVLCTKCMACCPYTGKYLE